MWAISRSQLCKSFGVADNIDSKCFFCVLRSNGFLLQTHSTNCPRAFYGCLDIFCICLWREGTAINELTVKYSSCLTACVRQPMYFLYSCPDVPMAIEPYLTTAVICSTMHPVSMSFPSLFHLYIPLLVLSRTTFLRNYSIQSNAFLSILNWKKSSLRPVVCQRSKNTTIG